MKEVFELVKVDKDKAILKVKELDNLTIAEYPFLNSKMAYITITRGRRHTMTVINKDGSTWSVDWGAGGYTLCSDSINSLKWAARDFFQIECGIPLDLTVENSAIKEAKVFYNRNCRAWQLNLRVGPYQEQNIWFEDCNNKDDVIFKAEKYIGKKVWAYKRAQTGIDTWEANFN